MIVVLDINDFGEKIATELNDNDGDVSKILDILVKYRGYIVYNFDDVFNGKLYIINLFVNNNRGKIAKNEGKWEYEFGGEINE